MILPGDEKEARYVTPARLQQARDLVEPLRDLVDPTEEMFDEHEHLKNVFYQQDEVDEKLDLLAAETEDKFDTSTGHDHDGTDSKQVSHLNLSDIGTNTHAQIDTHIADADKHREINDSGSGTTDLWSANKIQAEISAGGGTSDHGALTGLSDDDHTQYHNDTRGDARYYTQTQVDANFDTSTGHDHDGTDSKQVSHLNLSDIGTNTHAQIDTHIADADKHREINDSGSGTTDLWSASRISSDLSTKPDWEYTLSGAGKNVIDPAGSDPGGSTTAALVIDFGQAMVADDITLDVGGYIDADDSHWRAFLGGYYGWGSWMGLNAWVLGSAPFSEVQFGTGPSGSGVFVLGTESTSWSYPSVFVRFINSSFQQTIIREEVTVTWETDLSAYSLISKSTKVFSFLDSSESGWTGTFTNGDGDTVNVTNGIITGVS